jgi:uncharacterized protein
VASDPITGRGRPAAAHGCRQPAYLASPVAAPHPALEPPGMGVPAALEAAGLAATDLAAPRWECAAGKREDGAGAAGRRGAWLARLGYLTLPVSGFLVPLAVRLTAGRKSAWLRGHAAQGLNLWLTWVLYLVSATVMGAMLALDSPVVALAVMAPLVVPGLLVTLVMLARAAIAAGRGGEYSLPRWLCSRITR